MGSSIFGLGRIGLGHTHLGGLGSLCPFLSLFQRVFEWFSTFHPTMALLTTVETTSPMFRLIGHSDYGDVIAFIIYLTRIELGSQR